MPGNLSFTTDRPIICKTVELDRPTGQQLSVCEHLTINIVMFIIKTATVVPFL